MRRVVPDGNANERSEWLCDLTFSQCKTTALSDRRVQRQAAEALAALKAAAPERARLRGERLAAIQAAAEAAAGEGGGGAPSPAERRLLAGGWLPEELWEAVLAERPAALWCARTVIDYRSCHGPPHKFISLNPDVERRGRASAARRRR